MMTKQEMDKLAVQVEQLSERFNDQSKKMDKLMVGITGDRELGIEGLSDKVDDLYTLMKKYTKSVDVYVDNKADFVEMHESFTHWRWFIRGAKVWISLFGFGTLINLVMNFILLFIKGI